MSRVRLSDETDDDEPLALPANDNMTREEYEQAWRDHYFGTIVFDHTTAGRFGLFDFEIRHRFRKRFARRK